MSLRGPTTLGGFVGNVQDALYVRMEGVKGGTRITTPYTEYAEGGYGPGCWLDPDLNSKEMYFPVGIPVIARRDGVGAVSRSGRPRPHVACSEPTEE